MSWLSSHISAFTAAAGQCVCVCVCVCREGHPDRSHLWHLYTHSWAQKPLAGATNRSLTHTHTLRRRTVCVSVHAEIRSGAMGVRRDIQPISWYFLRMYIWACMCACVCYHCRQTLLVPVDPDCGGLSSWIAASFLGSTSLMLREEFYCTPLHHYTQ